MSAESKITTKNLIIFNNSIISMKNVINKAKVNIVQKLIRKIKQISSKKGNEIELKKNQRKCEHLKQEIVELKKLILNDIIIFALDNDGLTFETFMAKQKSPSSSEVAMARIAFHKLVNGVIEKLKSNTNLEGGWKKTFIQFKSRNEKRKNWKEKQSLCKTIEKNFEEIAGNDEIEKDKLISNEIDKKKKASKAKSIPDQEAKTNGKNNKSENNSHDIEDDYDDDDDDQNIPSDVDYNSDQYDNFVENDDSSDHESEHSDAKKSGENGKKKSSNPKVNNDSSDEQEEEEEEEEEINDCDEDDDDDDDEKKDKDESDEDDEEDDEKDNSNLSTSKRKMFDKPAQIDFRKKLKPLPTKESNLMVIKQLNLDELANSKEIPIVANNEESTQNNQVEEVVLGKAAKHFANADESNCKTLKAEEDPFFLDDKGNEIENAEHLRNLNKYHESRRNEYKAYNNDAYDNGENGYHARYDDREDFRNKRTALNSAYKTSLSSRNDYGRNSDRGDDGNGSKFNRYGSTSSYRDRNASRNGDNRRYDNNAHNQTKNFDRNSASTFNKKNQFSSSQKQDSARNKTTSSVEDTSKLHPSWLAKKQMEEKAKIFKFEGKKITFNDDD